MDGYEAELLGEKIERIGKAIEMSFAHPDIDNVTNALYGIAEALNRIAAALEKR